MTGRDICLGTQINTGKILLAPKPRVLDRNLLTANWGADVSTLVWPLTFVFKLFSPCYGPPYGDYRIV